MCENALLNVATRLRANLFDKEGSLLMSVVPYVPVPPNAPDGIPYDDRDSRRHGRGYSSGYGGSNDFPPPDPYNSYNSGLQVVLLTFLLHVSEGLTSLLEHTFSFSIHMHVPYCLV